MSPQVAAAIIAASVGVVTVIATVATQYFGRRATSRDTQNALEAQRVQLDRTLEAQLTRTLNERFATAADRLGSDKPSAVRLAGVYAMAGLADDWPKNRQTCIDVLCAYLRLPYNPDPGENAEANEKSAYQRNREVRHTVIRVITAHLTKDKDDPMSWQGLNFDFTGVVFDGGDFRGAKFSGGEVSFRGAGFSGGRVDFGGAEFPGGRVYFVGAGFSGGEVDFGGAGFSGGEVDFGGAKFSGGTVSFDTAEFSGGEVNFRGAKFCGGTVSFGSAEFSRGTVYFGGAEFSRGTVSFDQAGFSGGEVNFSLAMFSGGTVSFVGAGFAGGDVYFGSAGFSGGRVDFSAPRDWSVRPAFPWTDTPPPGVTLPGKEGQSQ
jgi:uncharacterized protein YjbI with pentapeptide repeats